MSHFVWNGIACSGYSRYSWGVLHLTCLLPLDLPLQSVNIPHYNQFADL